MSTTYDKPEAAAADYSIDDGKDLDTLPSNLYEYHETAVGIDGYESITDDDIEFFHRRGYLVVNNAFTPEEVAGSLDAMLDLIHGKHPNYKGIQFESVARRMVEDLPPEEKQDYVRKISAFVKFDERLMAMAEQPKLKALVERIIGETPVLYQDQALIKPPKIGREKPWHQDNAYFNLPPETTVVGVWIALDEATPENGCMHIIPATHVQGPVVHFKRRDWQICDTWVATNHTVAVPLKPGGMLLFHGLLHHGTPPTRSEKRRRALQFHYKPASIEMVNPKDRLAVFGSEGKDVTC